MAAVPPLGSRVILTFCDGRQMRGEVGLVVSPGKVTFREDWAATFTAIAWGEVWSLRVIEEPKATDGG